MAKKPRMGKVDRSNPRMNKSLAIRTVLRKMPDAKAKAVAEAVQKEFGHKVGENMVYMIKTKSNMASDGRPKRTKSAPRHSPMTTGAEWLEAIKMARALLKTTGGMSNAVALLKALEDK
jgi:hypothetical protein